MDYHTYYVGEVGVLVHNSCKNAVDNVADIADDAGNNAKTIRNLGKDGEKRLAEMVGGESQVYKKTGRGGRYIDQLSEGIAHESKVGYTSLSKRIKTQILKDAELVSSEKVKSAHWHFFKSSITGKLGGSKPLLQFLTDNGIGYTIYD